MDLFTLDPDGAADRLTAAGARKLGEHGEGRHRVIILADPQDNEFCVIRPGSEDEL